MVPEYQKCLFANIFQGFAFRLPKQELTQMDFSDAATVRELLLRPFVDPIRQN